MVCLSQPVWERYTVNNRDSPAGCRRCSQKALCVFAQSRGWPGCPLPAAEARPPCLQQSCLLRPLPSASDHGESFPSSSSSARDPVRAIHGRTLRRYCRGILIFVSEKRRGYPRSAVPAPRVPPQRSPRSPLSGPLTRGDWAAPRGPPCPGAARRAAPQPGGSRPPAGASPSGATSGRRGRFRLRLRRGFPPPRARLPATLSAERRGRGARCVTLRSAPLRVARGGEEPRWRGRAGRGGRR